MNETLIPDEYWEVGMDEPGECDMYVMYIKDFITDMPDNTVIQARNRDGHPLYKLTKWLYPKTVEVSVARIKQINGVFHYHLEVTVCKGKEQYFCTFSTDDFLPELDSLPELYDILREKSARNNYGHLTDALGSTKPPTKVV
jgi:hypothetical protein